ncbi:MAG TPA: hypothetical protein PLV93_08030 [Microthrixaceae bacterium]|nr:hypothetical protein [Microthrixaceae bacterium]
MPFDVSTKDCAQLNDSELAEMADLCAETPSRYEIGDLSKQAEAWVLVTQVREGAHLRGFSFSTLERIGGTPAIILGLAHVRRTSKRDQVLKGIMNDNYRRALMAFPDEDVLVGTRLAAVDGFEAFKVLVDINPRPDHKSSGEERAWGRRLAKRFGMEADYDDKMFVAKGNGSYPLVFDHESLKPERLDPEIAPFFKPLNAKRGDCLVAFGWIMAEELLKYHP